MLKKEKVEKKTKQTNSMDADKKTTKDWWKWTDKRFSKTLVMFIRDL